jgi:hypothetical protein
MHVGYCWKSQKEETNRKANTLTAVQSSILRCVIKQMKAKYS